MSKCIFKDIANKLNREELIEYYKTHIAKDVSEHFGFDQLYFGRIFDYLNIPRRSPKEDMQVRLKYYDMTDTYKKSSEARKKNGYRHSEETKEKIRKSNTGVKGNHKANNGSFKKGQTPWNKNKKGVQQWIEGQKERYYDTLNKNKWYKKDGMTKPEKEVYKELIEKYGEENIIYQYATDKRYPYNCDFYVISEDLFIEVNKWWHHGPHPYNSDSIEDNELLKIWIEKSKFSKQYENAIKTWTVSDKDKIETAKRNNLNYKLIY